MHQVLEKLAHAAGLAGIHDKVMRGERLSFDDGVTLYRSRELMTVGALANVVRERKNGDAAYFVRNMHLNPTNVCTVDCKFCGFYRPYTSKEQGWTWTLDRSLQEVRGQLRDSITEVHVVGGHNPDLPYSFYTDLIHGIREMRPDMHVKAFTAAEYDFFSKRFKKPLDVIFEDFKAAGLGSRPGGGAEILVERVRKAIYPKKLSAERWLEVSGTAHRHGLRSNATMLYGHVETLEERIEHLCRLRALQDETGGVMFFVRAGYHPRREEVTLLPGPHVCE